MKKKYGCLLQDENISRWFKNMCRGSEITANVYLRRLGSFCNEKKITPQELVKLDKRKIYDMFLDTVTDMEKTYAGSYTESVIKSVKSWLIFNDIKIDKKIIIRGAKDTPSLKDERVPTQPELRKIFLSGDLKARTICSLIAHSGVRLQVLGKDKGEDGLRLDDLPELKINNGEVNFEKIPTLVKVRASLSKTKKPYVTFLSAEGCEYLKEYLEMRMRKGEKLTGQSPIITPKTAKKSFITTINIGDAARNSIRKAGFPWRPYVLRSYFDTQLMLAESKGFVLRDYRQFFMGHVGDIERTYTLNKETLPPAVMKDLRDSYMKSQKYLQTIETSKDEDEIMKMFKRQMLLVAGFKADEITDEELELDDEEFQKIVRERLTKQMNGKNMSKQRAIETEDVEKYLSDGWIYVNTLPNSKIIMQSPLSF